MCTDTSINVCHDCGTNEDACSSCDAWFCYSHIEEFRACKKCGDVQCPSCGEGCCADERSRAAKGRRDREEVERHAEWDKRFARDRRWEMVVDALRTAAVGGAVLALVAAAAVKWLL